MGWNITRRCYVAWYQSWLSKSPVFCSFQNNAICNTKLWRPNFTQIQNVTLPWKLLLNLMFSDVGSPKQNKSFLIFFFFFLHSTFLIWSSSQTYRYCTVQRSEAPYVLMLSVFVFQSLRDTIRICRNLTILDRNRKESSLTYMRTSAWDRLLKELNLCLVLREITVNTDVCL